jgi:hypothetical protein
MICSNDQNIPSFVATGSPGMRFVCHARTLKSVFKLFFSVHLALSASMRLCTPRSPSAGLLPSIFPLHPRNSRLLPDTVPQARPLLLSVRNDSFRLRECDIFRFPCSSPLAPQLLSGVCVVPLDCCRAARKSQNYVVEPTIPF